MDIFSRMFDWLSDHEAGISAVAAIIVIGGVVFAGFRSLIRRRSEPGAEQALAGSVETPLTADSSPPGLDSLTAHGFSDTPAIAVLPLENLSGDPEQEYFADGMTEALICDLAKLRSLSVISRTSVMRYKQTDKSLPEIARELNVEGIIEGTVMRAGDRVRITAQLIDARSDRHLWSDRYDRELSDVLALQSEVARAVAEQIRLELSAEERDALLPSGPVDARAYDAYARCAHLRGPVTLVGSWGPQVIDQLERVVELDPSFAEAWAFLAWTRLMLAHFAYSRRSQPEMQKAREAAERALELDDRLVSAHLAMGYIYQRYDRDFAGGRRAVERAMELAPGDPEVLDAYAQQLSMEGRTQEKLEVVERLLRVAPLDPFYRSQCFRHFFMAREHTRAIEEIERIRELDPDWIDVDISTNYFMAGRLEEAYRALVSYLERGGNRDEAACLAVTRGWAEGGWDAAIRGLLGVLTGVDGFSPNNLAVVHMMIGETEEAFACLQRGCREREPAMGNLAHHPIWDPLRSDPRFTDLLRRLGLPER